MATATKPATRSAKKQVARVKLAQFPEVVQSQKRLDELREHHADLERQMADALRRAGSQAIGAAQIRLEAERLIQGKGADAPEDVRVRLGEIRHEIEVAAAATSMQNERLNDVVRGASKEICRNVRSDHELLVNKIDQMLCLLAEALAEETAFRRRLRSAGVHVSLPDAQLRVRFPDCGQREMARGWKCWRKRRQAQGYLGGPSPEPAPPRPTLPEGFEQAGNRHMSESDCQRRDDFRQRVRAAQEQWDTRYGEALKQEDESGDQ